MAAAAARSNTPGSSAWPNGGRFEDPAAPGARRVVLAVPDPVERGGHLRAVAAGGAHHAEHRAVQLDDPFVRRAGSLVQPVDVLRDHLGVDGAAGQPGQGAVRRVGLGGPGGMGQPGAPGPAPQLGVGHVVLVGRQPLRARVLCPDPGRPAEVSEFWTAFHRSPAAVWLRCATTDLEVVVPASDQIDAPMRCQGVG